MTQSSAKNCDVWVSLWSDISIKDYIVEYLKTKCPNIIIYFTTIKLPTAERYSSYSVKLFSPLLPDETKIKDVQKALEEMKTKKVGCINISEGFVTSMDLGDKFGHVINKDRIVMKYLCKEWCRECGFYLTVKDNFGWTCVRCIQSGKIIRDAKIRYYFEGDTREYLEATYLEFNDRVMKNYIDLYCKVNKKVFKSVKKSEDGLSIFVSIKIVCSPERETIKKKVRFTHDAKDNDPITISRKLEIKSQNSLCNQKEESQNKS